MLSLSLDWKALSLLFYSWHRKRIVSLSASWSNSANKLLCQEGKVHIWADYALPILRPFFTKLKGGTYFFLKLTFQMFSYKWTLIRTPKSSLQTTPTRVYLDTIVFLLMWNQRQTYFNKRWTLSWRVFKCYCIHWWYHRCGCNQGWTTAYFLFSDGFNNLVFM